MRESDLQISKWQGNSAYVFAPVGSDAADYVQIRLAREIERRAGPIVNPPYCPWGKDELFDPSGLTHDDI